MPDYAGIDVIKYSIISALGGNPINKARYWLKDVWRVQGWVDSLVSIGQSFISSLPSTPLIELRNRIGCVTKSIAVDSHAKSLFKWSENSNRIIDAGITLSNHGVYRRLGIGLFSDWHFLSISTLATLADVTFRPKIWVWWIFWRRNCVVLC